MNNKSYFINASGQMNRFLENEAIQTFYVMTKDPSENSRELSTPTVNMFQNMKPSDITFEWLVDNFGDLTSNSNGSRSVKRLESKYNMTDIIDIKIPYLGFKGKTTLGRLLYSKIIIEGCGLEKVLKFVNEPITNGKNVGTEQDIANALKEDIISVDNMYKFIDTRDWLGLQLHSVICTSFTMRTLVVPKEIEAKKKELLKKYKKELEANDEKAAEQIEKTLIKDVKELLKNDVGLDLYISGARGSMDNNYKNINLMRGAVKNLQTGGYDIVTNSLMDGLDKKDIASHANKILYGAYFRCVEIE